MTCTCKDCIHHNLCDSNECLLVVTDIIDDSINNIYLGNVQNRCGHFKNKADFVELPCKVWDTVYQTYELFNEKIIEELKVTEITFDIEGIKTLYGMTAKGSTYSFTRNYNLDQIKFTKEEAEQELKGGVE